MEISINLKRRRDSGETKAKKLCKQPPTRHRTSDSSTIITQSHTKTVPSITSTITIITSIISMKKKQKTKQKNDSIQTPPTTTSTNLTAIIPTAWDPFSSTLPSLSPPRLFSHSRSLNRLSPHSAYSQNRHRPKSASVKEDSQEL